MLKHEFLRQLLMAETDYDISTHHSKKV